MATAFASYAGVKLPLWTADAETAVAALPPERFARFPAVDRTALLPELPLPPVAEPPPLRLGTLWWPTGASQWATAYFVVNTAKLSEIRDQLVADAGSASAGYEAADLVLDDGVGGTVTAAMHLLPPLPLLGPVGGEQLHLLPLVDERYWWWHREAITPSASWSAIESALEGGLGETITVDGSISTFAAPSSAWASLGDRPQPLLLDAMAWSLGRRVVRRFDGTVRLEDYATARAAASAVRVAAGVDWWRIAGGVAASADARKASAPASVAVRGGGTSQIVNLASLAPAEYGGVTGKAGYRTTLRVDAATLTTGQAEAVAREWYKWRLAAEDVRYAALVDVQPNGWSAGVEWSVRRDDVSTRFVPYPLDFGAANVPGSGDDPCGGRPYVLLKSCIEVTKDCTGTYVTDVTQVSTYQMADCTIACVEQPPGDCCDEFWCTESGVVSHPIADRDTPPEGAVSGPYPTEELAEAACGLPLSCCGVTQHGMLPSYRVYFTDKTGVAVILPDYIDIPYLDPATGDFDTYPCAASPSDYNGRWTTTESVAVSEVDGFYLSIKPKLCLDCGASSASGNAVVTFSIHQEFGSGAIAGFFETSDPPMACVVVTVPGPLTITLFDEPCPAVAVVPDVELGTYRFSLQVVDPGYTGLTPVTTCPGVPTQYIYDGTFTLRVGAP